MTPDDDRLASAAAERLLAPERRDFFDALWRRVDAEERQWARQRRCLGFAVALATGVAAAAAAVYAAPAISPSSHAGTAVVDRTYSCGVLQHEGERWIDLLGEPRIPYIDAKHNPSGKAGPVPAALLLATVERTAADGKLVPPFDQLAVEDVKKPPFVDRSACRASRRQLPLTHEGLVPQGTVTVQQGDLNDRCRAKSRVAFRVRVVVRDGTPIAARLAIRDDDARRRPLAYVDWRPERITSFLATRCTPK